MTNREHIARLFQGARVDFGPVQDVGRDYSRWSLAEVAYMIGVLMFERAEPVDGARAYPGSVSKAADELWGVASISSGRRGSIGHRLRRNGFVPERFAAFSGWRVPSEFPTTWDFGGDTSFVVEEEPSEPSSPVRYRQQCRRCGFRTEPHASTDEAVVAMGVHVRSVHPSHPGTIRAGSPRSDGAAKARSAVLEVLASVEGPSAMEITELSDFYREHPNFGDTHVYGPLRALEDAGMVEHVTVNRQRRYYLKGKVPKDVTEAELARQSARRSHVGQDRSKRPVQAAGIPGLFPTPPMLPVDPSNLVHQESITVISAQGEEIVLRRGQLYRLVRMVPESHG